MNSINPATPRHSYLWPTKHATETRVGLCPSKENCGQFNISGAKTSLGEYPKACKGLAAISKGTKTSQASGDATLLRRQYSRIPGFSKHQLRYVPQQLFPVLGELLDGGSPFSEAPCVALSWSIVPHEWKTLSVSLSTHTRTHASTLVPKTHALRLDVDSNSRPSKSFGHQAPAVQSDRSDHLAHCCETQ